MDDFIRQTLEFFSSEEREIIQRYLHAQEYGESYYIDSNDLEIIIDFYIQINDPVKALSILERALKLNPDSDELLFRKAQLIRQIHPTKALEIIDKLLKQSLDTDFLRLKMELLFEQGQVEEGKQILADYIKKVTPTEQARAYYDIGLFLLSMSSQSIEFSSSNDPYNNLALEVLTLGNKSAKKKISEVLYFANILNEFQSIEASKLLYNHAIDLDPYNEQTWKCYTDMLMDNGLYGEALDALGYRSAINNTSDHYLHNDFGECLLMLERYDQALSHFLLQIEENNANPDLDDHNSQIFSNIGECYEMLEQYELASTYYITAIEHDKTNIDSYVGLANCYNKKENYQSAIILLNQAKEILKEFDGTYTSPDLFTSLGEALSFQGDDVVDKNYYQQAIDAYKEALQLLNGQEELFDEKEDIELKNVSRSKILANIGNLHLQLEQYPAALENYLQAYALYPMLESIDISLSMAYFKLNQDAQAMKHFLQAQRIDNNARQFFVDLFPEADDFLNKLPQY